MEELKTYLKDSHQIDLVDMTDILTMKNLKKVLFDDFSENDPKCLFIDMERLDPKIKKLLNRSVDLDEFSFVLVKYRHFCGSSKIGNDNEWKKSISKWLKELNLYCQICETDKMNFYMCHICHQSFCTDCLQQIESVSPKCPYCRSQFS